MHESNTHICFLSISSLESWNVIVDHWAANYNYVFCGINVSKITARNFFHTYLYHEFTMVLSVSSMLELAWYITMHQDKKKHGLNTFPDAVISGGFYLLGQSELKNYACASAYKSYDRIEWHYLQAILLKLGFHDSLFD
jgi:hypothetical protein